jgi:uncharacterized phage protein (TIGR02220 family)
MPADQWLKLHTSLLSSAKFSQIEDPKHKWAYVVFMIFCKKALITRDTKLTPNVMGKLRGELRANVRGIRSIMLALTSAGLIRENGWVVGFENSQLGKSGHRMRKLRVRHSDVTVTQSVTTEERGERKEKNKKKISFIGPALEVIDHLNHKVGRDFKSTTDIEARLKDGGSVDECKEIINFKVSQWADTDQAQYLVPKTLFRKGHWEDYLDEAQAGPINGIKKLPFLKMNPEAL